MGSCLVKHTHINLFPVHCNTQCTGNRCMQCLIIMTGSILPIPAIHNGYILLGRGKNESCEAHCSGRFMVMVRLKSYYI